MYRHMPTHPHLDRDSDDQGVILLHTPAGDAQALILHMTFTQGVLDPWGYYCTYCRCGWRSPDTYNNRNWARAVGDAHLKEANR